MILDVLSISMMCLAFWSSPMMCLAGRLSKTSVEDIVSSFSWMKKVIKFYKRTNRQIIICSFHITVADYSLPIDKQTNLLQ